MILGLLSNVSLFTHLRRIGALLTMPHKLLESIHIFITVQIYGCYIEVVFLISMV